MSHPTADEGSKRQSDRPRTGRGRRAFRLLLGALAVAGVVLLIVWLPPNEDVEADVKVAVLEHELSREAAWPKGAALGLPLSPADEHLLAVTLRTNVARHAAGEALEGYNAEDVADAFADAAAADLVHVVTRWKGEIVYFDFVRHTLPTGVIVRAAVLQAQRVGRVDAVHQQVYARRWVWQERAEIFEYTLRQTEGVWKVVEVEPWGSCDVDGSNVAEGTQPM